MANPKKFFHDHIVLLLLSINTFLALAVVTIMFVRLGSSHNSNYIVQYRPTLGIGSFIPGSITGLFSFVGFSLITLFTHAILSMRAYHVRRQLSLAILSLGILLQILTLIVSNALLALL